MNLVLRCAHAAFVVEAYDETSGEATLRSLAHPSVRFDMRLDIPLLKRNGYRLTQEGDDHGQLQELRA